MNVNKDLQNERNKCSFNVRELTEFIDGGKNRTLERKHIEKLILAQKDELFGGTPEDYLSHKEKYERAIQTNVIILKIVQDFMRDANGGDLTNYRDVLTTLLNFVVSREGTPFALHFMMFLPVFLSQADEEQQMEWLPRAWNCNIIGSYAQTELGHGTFIRGLETTATYDAATKEFVLHSPTVTSYKWWPGALGHTANYCVVVAQLHTKGQCHGIHSFIVQVRDEETHMPLAGIRVGEIGAKMGLNMINNGFIGFNHVRIPRRHLLMKHAQVLEDGTYVKSRNSKLNYGAMVFVRVVIVFDSVNYLSKAVTIATRFAAVRRQSQLKANEPECQIIDFLTQQHKLFIGIATCHALKMTATKLWDTFNEVQQQLRGGNLERLPELHALACCLKAVSTADTAALAEGGRRACGGHGYMRSSGLPQTCAVLDAACTFEGDNTVLLLQTARFLVKVWRGLDTLKLTPTVAYLRTTLTEGFNDKWENTVEGIIKGFQTVSMRKISECVSCMAKRIMSGMSQEEAWNMTSVQLVAAAESHCRVIIISYFHEEFVKVSSSFSPALRRVMKLLVELYTLYWALDKLQDLLKYTSISKTNTEQLQERYEDTLNALRPDAVGLVDAFDIMDEILQSTLGAYDGRVYERLMEEALKSPLNAEPVNRSFHQYLKPLMQGKL
ncbi:probable peroxisomal acyl-coenzyme A oxidase 1 isoform X1 [Bombyx mandarina]|uniref:Acyl-coenzyme A oxidase n=1 Tax=Bombyx mandarina TaxID=7092 RepID=A0A6J2JP60_BOMMA|nr:probable peroxisomal acyl-coenzyme A oxidase 1 isoform X1 [Bombyx mandarina]